MSGDRQYKFIEELIKNEEISALERINSQDWPGISAPEGKVKDARDRTGAKFYVANLLAISAEIEIIFTFDYFEKTDGMEVERLWVSSQSMDANFARSIPSLELIQTIDNKVYRNMLSPQGRRARVLRKMVYYDRECAQYDVGKRFEENGVAILQDIGILFLKGDDGLMLALNYHDPSSVLMSTDWEFMTAYLDQIDAFIEI